MFAEKLGEIHSFLNLELKNNITRRNTCLSSMRRLSILHAQMTCLRIENWDCVIFLRTKIKT